jgi:hypothetical protein
MAEEAGGGERRYGDPWEVPLAVIREDTRISPRVKLSQKQVQSFAAIMRERGVAEFPPALLAGPREDGLYAILDGRHRIAAAGNAGLDSFPARVQPWSTPRELFREAVQASSRHGLPLTSREKRLAVQQLLRDWPEASCRELAEMAGCRHNLVSVCRRELENGPAAKPPRRKPAQQHVVALLQAFDGWVDLAGEPGDHRALQAAGAREARRYYECREADPERSLARLARWVEAMRRLLNEGPGSSQ